MLSTIALLTLLTGAEAAPPPNRTLLGPFVHENLTVFLIRGEDRLKGRNIITLAEALASKKVVVHETGQVSELSIENRSDVEVFVQAGDIVKGGRQDRVLSVDAILPPKSGQVPVSSFCVESGRWSQRGGESSNAFSASNAQLATKSLKLAARKAKDQGEVWKEVAATQEKLSNQVGKSVRDGRSDTSLQLTLENGDVQRRIAAYVEKLSPAPRGKEDVVGFVFAINGRFNSAEVFASPSLFTAQWDKLIRAAAVEAVAEGIAEKAPPARAADAEGFLAKPRKKGDTHFENDIHESYY